MTDIEKSMKIAPDHQRGRRAGLPISLTLLMTLSALTSTAVFVLSLVWLAGYSFVIIPVSWFLTVLHHGSLVTTHLVHLRRQRQKQAQEHDGKAVAAVSLISSTPSSAIRASTSGPPTSSGFSVRMEVKPAVGSVQAPLSDPRDTLGIGDRTAPSETGAPTYHHPLPLSLTPINRQSLCSFNATSANQNEHDAHPSPFSPSPPSNAANNIDNSKVPTNSDLPLNLVSSAVIHPVNIITTCLLATIWSAASWLPIGTAIIFDPQWPGSRVLPALQGAIGYLEAAIMWVMFAICLYWRLRALRLEERAVRE